MLNLTTATVASWLSKIGCLLIAWGGAVAVTLQGIYPVWGQVEEAALQQDTFQVDVLELLGQLESDRLATRLQAERGLIELGPAILAYLPQDTANLSAEAKLRLRRVRTELEKQRTAIAATPTTIHLQGALTLDDALQRLTRATGIEFQTSENRETLLGLGEVGPLLFWQALDLTLDSANLDVDFYRSRENRLLLIPAANERPQRFESAAYAGIYRLEPTIVNARRVLVNPQRSALNVTVQLAWEPRLTPLGLSLPHDELRAKLDSGEELQSIHREGVIVVATNPELPFSEVQLPFGLPTGAAKSIDSLSGTIEAMLPGPVETFKFPLREGGGEAKQGAVRLKVAAPRPNGDLHEIRVSLFLEDPERSLESHRHWIFENRVYSIGPDDSRKEHLGLQVFRQTSSEVGLSYLFDLDGKPETHTFYYQTPTGVAATTVTFVISDLSLP